MYGKLVTVFFKGKTRELMIFGIPSLSDEAYQEMALKKLTRLEERYPTDFEWAYYGLTKGYNVLHN